ncbi:response regulator [Altibacter sp. HG106]|uniref:response regulator n=1 Tax=Altibacter sp. HG106 TaxID=3023937 RepID=UPI002350D6CF|nr:response regulator [Altibacter sp. HG106]MDC7996145.1 response regulator [Altibacter sp. HG106]
MKSLYVLLISTLCCSFCFAQVDTTQQSPHSITLSPKKRELQVIDSLLENVMDKYYKKDYATAIALGNELAARARLNGHFETEVQVNSFIGNSFLRSGDTIASRDVFLKNMKLANSINSDERILTTRIDLANIYALQEQYAKANEMYLDALPFARKSKDTSSLFVLNSNITEINLRAGNVAEAQMYLAATKKYAKLTKQEIFISYAGLLEGWVLYLRGRYQDASEVFVEIIASLEKMQFTEALVELYNYYSLSEAALGNHEKAYELVQKYNEYQEIKYEADKIAAIETATAQYKVNQYQQDLREQELTNQVEQERIAQETTIFWVKIAGAILLVASIFLFVSYLRRKKLLKNLIVKNKQYLDEKEKAEELSRAKSVLFSNVTHELRTPMYGIIGISSMLMQDSLEKKQKKHVNLLKFSAEYLLSLINNVLYFNKTEAEKNDVIKKERFNLSELIHHSLETTKFLNTEHPNRYEVHISEALPKELIGDPAKISQLLINVLSNATKFTSNGTITVTADLAETSGGEIKVHFCIEDTGVGISEAKLKEVLKGLDRTDYTTNSFTGTGLGLPIVQKLVTQYNGSFEITSEEHKGTKVQITLPLQKAPVASSSASEKITEKAAPLFRQEILVVDDNKINQMVTGKHLEKLGATATTVGSGEDAIVAVERTSFDLILMDINMPGMDGFETTAHIRAINKTVPIIALTAVEKEKVVEKENFALMTDILIKPFKTEELVATLTKYITVKS